VERGLIFFSCCWIDSSSDHLSRLRIMFNYCCIECKSSTISSLARSGSKWPFHFIHGSKRFINLPGTGRSLLVDMQSLVIVSGSKNSRSQNCGLVALLAACRFLSTRRSTEKGDDREKLRVNASKSLGTCVSLCLLLLSLFLSWQLVTVVFFPLFWYIIYSRCNWDSTD
jgi:hypothetical protein